MYCDKCGAKKVENNLVEIVTILDRSGSMLSIKDDAIGSFNVFLSEQKKLDGNALFTLVFFNDGYDVVYDGVDLKDVKPLDNTTFVPRGMTALLDAIGKTIGDVKERISKTPLKQRPDKVLVAILTDGEENYSCEYTRDAIMKLINEKDENWEFLYLAANQDAIKAGGSIGIATSGCFNIAGDGSTFERGVGAGYAQFNAATTSYRTDGTTQVNDDQVEDFISKCQIDGDDQEVE